MYMKFGCFYVAITLGWHYPHVHPVLHILCISQIVTHGK